VTIQKSITDDLMFVVVTMYTCSWYDC